MISLPRHNKQKELFDVVYVDIEPVHAVKAMLPKPEFYGDIIEFLSRKVMRRQPISAEHEDIIDGQPVKHKDLVRRVDLGGFASTILVRETHDSTLPRDASLKRIYVGDRGLGEIIDPVAGRIAPRKFSVYSPTSGDVYHVPLWDFPSGGTDEQAYESTDLEILTGNSTPGLLIARHHAYITLANLAGMSPPQPIEIKIQ